jgi:hypothetical protein
MLGRFSVLAALLFFAFPPCAVFAFFSAVFILLSIKELKILLFISLFRPFPVKAFSKRKGEKESRIFQARHAAKRKRNNWRGPFGEAAVYAVVFLQTTSKHTTTVPNFD